MNKTAAVLGFLTLVALGLIGVVVILIVAPTSAGVLTSFVLTVLAVASTSVVLFYGMSKQDEKLQVIQRQTNGTLSALSAAIETKDLLIQDLLTRMPADPPVDGPTGPSTQMI